jgi:hypothetical protein
MTGGGMTPVELKGILAKAKKSQMERTTLSVPPLKSFLGKSAAKLNVNPLQGQSSMKSLKKSASRRGVSASMQPVAAIVLNAYLQRHGTGTGGVHIVVPRRHQPPYKPAYEAKLWTDILRMCTVNTRSKFAVVKIYGRQTGQELRNTSELAAAALTSSDVICTTGEALSKASIVPDGLTTVRTDQLCSTDLSGHLHQQRSLPPRGDQALTASSKALVGSPSRPHAPRPSVPAAGPRDRRLHHTASGRVGGNGSGRTTSIDEGSSYTSTSTVLRRSEAASTMQRHARGRVARHKTAQKQAAATFRKEAEMRWRALQLLQSCVRRFSARKAVVKAVNGTGVLLAMPGTVQGRSGWYQGGEKVVEMEVLGDLWTKVRGPMSMVEWKGMPSEGRRGSVDKSAKELARLGLPDAKGEEAAAAAAAAAAVEEAAAAAAAEEAAVAKAKEAEDAAAANEAEEESAAKAEEERLAAEAAAKAEAERAAAEAAAAEAEAERVAAEAAAAEAEEERLAAEEAAAAKAVEEAAAAKAAEGAAAPAPAAVAAEQDTTDAPTPAADA